MKDYYKILELEGVANDDEIKKAYKRLALKYHPDKNQTFGSEEQFKEIGEAYEVLSDPIKKQEYDKAKNGNVSSGPTTFIFTYHGDPLATFSQFFSSHPFMMPPPMAMFHTGGPIPPPPDHMPPPMAMFPPGGPIPTPILSHPPPATFMIGPGHPAPLPPTFQMTPQHGLVTGGTMFPQGPGGQGYVLTPPPPQAPRPPTIIQGTAPMGPPHCQLEQLPSIIPRPAGTAFVYRYY